MNKNTSLNVESGLSNIVCEDIQNLAQALKLYWPKFEGKSFLITGAYGFLGQYMVYLMQYLNENCLKNKAQALLLDNFATGYKQKIISSKELVFYDHNVIKPFNTDEPIDYIIHAAGIASPAYYIKYPIETMDVGTIGTKNMLELARLKKVKSFLFISSSEVYGDPDNDCVPTNEEYEGKVSITGPRACYDESKRFGETICVTYRDVYKIPVKIVRPFNIYGPGIRPNDFRVLPNFIEHALGKNPIPIHGTGENTRSFCYINDAIEAIFMVLFSDKSGEAFNIGNPDPEISIKEVAGMVAKMVPSPVEVLFIKPPYEVYAKTNPKRRCPDISKIKKSIGYKPRYGLEKGLIRTIKWFCEQHPTHEKKI